MTNPTPFANGLVLFALQGVLGVTAGWLVSLLAGTGAVFLGRVGYRPVDAPLADCDSGGDRVWRGGRKSYRTGGRTRGRTGAELKTDQGEEAQTAPTSLPPILWPQAIAGLFWSALLALFVAAVPYYGGQFPPFAFFIQAVIFIAVFGGLSFILRRALR